MSDCLTGKFHMLVFGTALEYMYIALKTKKPLQTIVMSSSLLSSVLVVSVISNWQRNPMHIATIAETKR